MPVEEGAGHDLGGARMNVRQLGGLLGVAGGVVWIARLALADHFGGEALLRVVGLGLVLLGLVCVGLTLVKGQALWLDGVVGFAAPALFWAVYEVVRTEVGHTAVLHAALGAVAVVVGGVLLSGGPARDVHDEERTDQHA